MAVSGTPAHVDVRRIGESTVTIVSEGILVWAPQLQAPEADWRAAMPEADADGRIASGLNIAHVQLGETSILVDPGYPDPSPEAQREAPRVTRTAGLRAAMEQIGLQPEQVTHVLITHPHDDHFCGLTIERDGRRVARFPRACHLMGRADWEDNPNRQQAHPAFMRHLGTIERLGQFELIDGDREVAPGIAILHAPGETPGHSILRVRSGGEAFYYLGDLFHHPCEFEHLDWVSPGRDRPAAIASRRRLIEEAVAGDATLVYTHGQFPPWGHVVTEGDGYRWEQR